MGVDVTLRDGDRQALIRPDGGLAVGPPADDLVAVLELGTDNAVVVGITPKAGFDILVTAALFTANRSVGADGATTNIYYSPDKTSTDTTNTIIPVNDQAKNTAIQQSGLHKRVPEGNYVLGATDDDDVTVALDYHFTPKDDRA